MLQFAVDGHERQISRTTRKHLQNYSVTIGNDIIEAQKPVSISYTVRTIARKDTHWLYLDIEQPSRDVRITVDYADTDITVLTALDMIPSMRPTRIEHSPESVSNRELRMEIDGWVFPQAGVAYIWTLERERHGGTRSRTESDTGHP